MDADGAICLLCWVSPSSLRHLLHEPLQQEVQSRHRHTARVPGVGARVSLEAKSSIQGEQPVDANRGSVTCTCSTTGSIK